MKRLNALVILATITLSFLAGCGGNATAGNANALTIGAYSIPESAYDKIIPLFAAQWKQQTGKDLTFKTSYAGSGTQSRAIINGFAADVAALSLAPDIDAIAKAGLITHDWTQETNKGIVTESVVSFAVRQGNPKGIHDWADLAKPGIQIMCPDPKTSGGARWNILALYGAALRGEIRGIAKGDTKAAYNFLVAVLKNVKVFDKDGQTSLTNFEKGIGDVAITYESSVLVAQKAGETDQLVTPTSTILIQNPVAVVDAYVDKHGNRKAAEAFVNFLFTPQAQQIFADDSGALLGFARGVGEFGAIVLVSANIPYKTETAAVYVQGAIESGDYVTASAISLLLLVIALALVIIVETLRDSATSGGAR